MNYTYTQLGLTQTYRLVDSGIFKHSMDFHVIIQHLVATAVKRERKSSLQPIPDCYSFDMFDEYN